MAQARQSELSTQLSESQAARAILEADNAKIKRDFSEFRSYSESSANARNVANSKLRTAVDKAESILQQKTSTFENELAEMKEQFAALETAR